MNVLTLKLKEVLYAVLPITILVLILHFTITPLDALVVIRFLLGAVLIIFGLSLFLVGVDIGITPLGSLTGGSLARSNRFWIILLAGLILGFFVSIAEPGLLVLANQVDIVTGGQISGVTILIVVSIGLAILIALGFFRIFYSIPLVKILFILYFIILILSVFTSSGFLAIAFDASGATTGVLAVPFILALSVGISALKKDSKSSEKDSFGLIAIASTGAILSIMVLNIVLGTSEFSGGVLQSTTLAENGVLGPFFIILPQVLLESIFALLPLLIILIVLQKISFKLSKKSFRKVFMGFVYAFIGLTLFLTGVNAGFMDVGSRLGEVLALMENKAYVVLLGLVLGIVTILAEPAVYVLVHQIEDVTSGYVKKKSVLIFLSAGVGFAVALSILRVLVPEIQLWHYLLPGYVLCFMMTFFVPKLFVGIAFDAGGVATGPMTATFILAFTQGAADAFEGADLLIDGFGMIALVALMPILTLQMMGWIYKIRTVKGGMGKNDA